MGFASVSLQSTALPVSIYIFTPFLPNTPLESGRYVVSLSDNSLVVGHNQCNRILEKGEHHKVFMSL